MIVHEHQHDHATAADIAASLAKVHLLPVPLPELNAGKVDFVVEIGGPLGNWKCAIAYWSVTGSKHTFMSKAAALRYLEDGTLPEPAKPSVVDEHPPEPLLE